MITILLALALAQDPKPLPADPGLDGGKDGHWGKQGEKDWADARWNKVDVGPFMSSSLALPGAIVARSIAVRLGADRAACFDAKSLSVRAVWSGGFVKFGPARFGLIETPVPAGAPTVLLGDGPAWGDSRVRYRGFHLHGVRVVFEYEVDGARVLDALRVEGGAVVRTLQLDPCPHPRSLRLADDPAAVVGDAVTAGRLALPPSPEPRLVAVTYGTSDYPPENLAALLKPGPARWGPPIEVKGVVSIDPGPYVLDTIPVPFENPWKALMFLSGHDFLPDGSAAVCSAHGDVWIVSGIDAKLDRVGWKRYATGLHQPLGLKVVDGLVHVQGRDRITRLRDLDGDGEADVYESVSDLRPTSVSGHDYVACLETDAEGNWYGVGPTTFHRVSKDGTRFEVLATGLRNPNGLAVAPDGTAVGAPQEGEWTPASMICELKRGAHFGYKGPKDGRTDPPLCYLPRLMDNSTGGQAWVTSERWGPLQGRLLSFSFGRSSMQLVLRTEVGGVAQGAVTSFPLLFASGAMRGRFHPGDGQLYVSGMKGWVTNAVRDGSFQRVRYTGAPVALPVGWAVEAGRLRVRFEVPLDRETAQDPDRWSLEQWNYRSSEKYGSEDYSVAEPERKGHDGVDATSIRLSDDGKEVSLEIPGLRPVHQLRLRASLKTAAGAAFRAELVCTIHKVP
jgi:hypothetical protein